MRYKVVRFRGRQYKVIPGSDGAAPTLVPATPDPLDAASAVRNYGSRIMSEIVRLVDKVEQAGGPTDEFTQIRGLVQRAQRYSTIQWKVKGEGR